MSDAVMLHSLCSKRKTEEVNRLQQEVHIRETPMSSNVHGLLVAMHISIVLPGTYFCVY